MNKQLIFCLSIFLLLAACKKEEPYEIKPIFLGETTTEINGAAWSQQIQFVRLNESGRLSFSAYKYGVIDGVKVPFEGLSFENIERNNVIQLIRSYVQDSSFLSATFGTSVGDQVCDFYKVLESDSINNWIQITKQKDDYNEVWGNYSITFLRTRECAASPYTDTLRFRNGSFHFKFK